MTPIVNAGLDQEVCEFTQVILTASNPDNAVISWDNGVIDGIAFDPPAGPGSVTTTYEVTASLCGGQCFSTDQVDVTVHPMPVVAFEGDDLLGCLDHTVNFGNNSTEQFDCVWDLGDGTTISSCDSITYVYQTAGIMMWA